MEARCGPPIEGAEAVTPELYQMLAKAKHKEDDSIYSILLVFAAHYNDYRSVCDLLQTCPNTLARRRAGRLLDARREAAPSRYRPSATPTRRATGP